jgi:hypothetical protein
MSAHAVVKLKPVSGKKVMVAGGAPIKAGEPYTLVDGSMVIPPEKCARFSPTGDAAEGRKELRFLIEAENDREVRFGPAVYPKNVRIATEADEPAIFDLLMMDMAENAARVAMPDPERIMSHIQTGTRMKGTICGVIDGPAGKPVAVTLLVPMQWWWSREWHYAEMPSFVHPDHRKSRYAHDLVAFQRAMGDKLSESYGHRIYVLLGVLGLKRVREKTIMIRRKMRQVGSAFLYPCPYGDDERMT